MQGASRQTVKRIIICLLCACSLNTIMADPGRIYTAPDPSATGGIEGVSPVRITHALAVDHERANVYRATVAEDGKSFSFSQLPVGKYDLVLVDAGKTIYEGLSLGDPADHLSPASMANLKKRIELSDAFFNTHSVHRMGTDPDHTYAFVERLRDRDTLTQAGVAMGNVRRLEIIQLDKADDDWQLTETRHIYREEEPKNPNAFFMKDYYISDLGNIRVVDSVKKLPPFTIPNS